jgi:hypothetical protein
MRSIARITCTAAVAASILLAGAPPLWVHDVGAFTAPLGLAPDAIDPDGIRFRILTYNVHALPEILAGDKPRRRLPLIGGRISDDYDVALLQENFVFPRQLEKALTRTPFSLFNGNGPVTNESPEAGFKQFLASIASRIFAGRGMPLSSGLTTVVINRQELRATELVRRPFDVCDGYFLAKADCLASKGVLGVRLAGPGVEVDLYNTHLDARGSNANRDVRERQLAIVAEEIRRHSQGRAVIVAGDLNSRRANNLDRAMLESFQQELGLLDAGARRDESWTQDGDLDYILYRSGPSTRLEPAGVGEDTGFRWGKGRKRLSDHPALFAHFRAVPR